jgi:hypothetical protein
MAYLVTTCSGQDYGSRPHDVPMGEQTQGSKKWFQPIPKWNLVIIVHYSFFAKKNLAKKMSREHSFTALM